ncbi:TetR/AcrR family transcriptional regulator [Bifidobacterium breve]|uniref:TetR/AcrR family transcriptional regulator n=1 Tax=Bifidobacterium breve TaxID=1685 RepID=UPI001E367741|nr:TetR/AcrR family transcriptional regulator [Bifidobacterium breve]
MKTTKEAVIKATSDLADEKGLNNVSLKAVAQKLNIRTPSLYNHIESYCKYCFTHLNLSRYRIF